MAWQNVKWLAWLAKGGVKFGRSLTLGRQNLYMNEAELSELLSKFGFSAQDQARFLSPKPKYAEPLFQLLGADKVDSMDASSYEHASFVHDLNEPLPPELRNCFDLVFDGGTLEHVFNFPEALRSAMALVKVGGSLVSNQVFNNMVGHGFYCFGPEVFYQSLSEENGFVLKNVRIYERYPRSPWHQLPDPNTLKSRVRLISWGLESEILIHAVKVADVPIFRRWPQQSDYLDAWSAPGDLPKAQNDAHIRLGVSTAGPLGSLKASAMRPLRRRALASPVLGRLGKYWLNVKNFGLRAQQTHMGIDDPFQGGGPPRA